MALLPSSRNARTDNCKRTGGFDANTAALAYDSCSSSGHLCSRSCGTAQVPEQWTLASTSGGCNLFKKPGPVHEPEILLQGKGKRPQVYYIYLKGGLFGLSLLKIITLIWLVYTGQQNKVCQVGRRSYTASGNRREVAFLKVPFHQ